MTNPLPIPTRTESHEAFAIRAHRSLMSRVKDPDDRNRVVKHLWAKYRGATEEDAIAAKAFPGERFVKHADVAVFAEHDAVDGEGNPRKYDLKELCRILRACNHRIADFDGFAPISDGHTPDDPADPDPDILGYAGPYRLGMIGRKKPRWAIFADEFHLKEHADRLRGKPRRSVELWTFKNQPQRTHFDPVAAIGAETPRLALPTKFQRTMKDGALVEKYTFSAPAMGSMVLPGAGNTFTQKFERNKSMLANEDIGQIMQALQETPQFKLLDELLQERQAGGQPEEGAGKTEYMGAENYMEGEDELPDDGGTPAPPMEEEDDLADLSGLLNEDEEPKEEDYMRGNPHIQRHSRRSDGNGTVSPEEFVSVEKFTRLQSAHNQLVKRYGGTIDQLETMRKRAADGDRTAKITELAQQFPGFIDTEEELDVVCYSRQSNMTDEAFDAHYATLEKFARKAAQNVRMNRGDLPSGEVDRGRHDADTRKYQEALNKEAVKIHMRMVNKGQNCTYEEAVEEAKKIVQR